MLSVRIIVKCASCLAVVAAVGASILTSSAFVSGCSSAAEPTLNPQPLPPNNPDPNPNDPNQDKQNGQDNTGAGGMSGSATNAPAAADGGEGGTDGGGG